MKKIQNAKQSNRGTGNLFNLHNPSPINNDLEHLRSRDLTFMGSSAFTPKTMQAGQAKYASTGQVNTFQK
mgnify:CR=1 FL=1